MKIYIPGHLGMVGSAVSEVIAESKTDKWVGKTRNELDLKSRNDVFDYIHSSKPDAVILAAAKVGGILANSTFPVEFLSENIQIQTNILDACHSAGIKKLIFLGSSCIYPKFAEQPISENSLLSSALEQTNEAYAIAKIAGVKLVNFYRSQYGHSWTSLMPTNLYGPGDNFDPTSSHVIPAIIRKMHDAAQSQAQEVTLWGTGEALREFMHSRDLAEACIHVLGSEFGYDYLNVGSGYEISIKELAIMISKIVGFKGEILWDSNKPNGTPRKLLDSTRIRELGWSPKIHLEDGLKHLYQYFLSQQSLATNDK